MSVSPLAKSFIQHFGEMGSRWGVNKTVGQICGLLLIHEEPLNAEQIGEILDLSRSNVSISLKELHAWNLLIPVQISGDRKDYFSVPDDLWEIAGTLIEERRKREIDPTLSKLRNMLLKESDNEPDEYAVKRITEMHDILELLVSWAKDMQTLKSNRLEKLLLLGSGVNKVLDATDKLAGKLKPVNKS